MKLEQDRIVLESRYEIDDVQMMIKVYKEYLKKTGSSPARLSLEELDRLNNQLETLFMCW